jgi:hypothetical protein
MGAWGTQFDENDSALDWLAEFTSNPSWSSIDDLFDMIIDADDANDVEVDESSAILVGAEIMAAAFGKPSPRLNAEMVTWAQSNADGATALRKKAIKASELVRDESELSDLWEESDEGEEWTASIDDLISRLS